MDISNFWGSNFYEHPPLTDEMISIAESSLGVRLPQDLVSLLRVQNGGYTTKFVVPTEVKNSWADDHIPLDELFGIVVDDSLDSAQNILETEYMTEEWGLPEKQVLLAGEGHWWITLDYRSGEEPKVMWLDVECDESFEIAPSFANFLSMLIPTSEYGQL